MVANWPTVVLEYFSIVNTSLCRVCRAVVSAVLVVVVPVLVVVVPVLVELLIELATACAWWWNPPMWDRTVRSSRQSQASSARLGLRVVDEDPLHQGEASVFQTFPVSLIGSSPQMS
jgi:hypothetical protein